MDCIDTYVPKLIPVHKVVYISPPRSKFLMYLLQGKTEIWRRPHLCQSITMIFPVYYNHLASTVFNAQSSHIDYLDYNFLEAQDVREDPRPDGVEQPAARPSQPEEIKRIFHPHSQRHPTFQSFDDYVASNMAEQPVPADPQPWRPFRSQLDFEVAEFCEDNLLNKDSTETLISLIRRCIFNPDEFTLAGQCELDELWELASHKCTPVRLF